MSENLIRVFSSVAAEGVPAEVVAKAVQGLARATEQMGRNMVENAMALLKENGITVEKITLFQFLNFAANAQLERLRFYGLLKKDPVTAPRLDAVNAQLKNDPKNPKANELRIVALFLDVAHYSMRHYLPTHTLLEQLATASPGYEPPDPGTVQPVPSSSEAMACRDGLLTVKFVNHKTKAMVYEPVTVSELLEEPFLSEEQAARLIHLSPKTLADQRRAGKVDASAFVQQVDGGTVHYHTSTWLELNKPKAIRPDAPRNVKSRVPSTELPDLPTETSRKRKE